MIHEEKAVDFVELGDPIETAEEAIANLSEAIDLIQSIVNDLKRLEEVEA